MSTALILGAGFSYVGGLPLTKDLFVELPKFKRGLDEQRMVAVKQAFEAWRASNHDSGPEIWMREMYNQRADAQAMQALGTEWDDIVQYVARRVSNAKNAKAGPYYYGITRHDVPSEHRSFWKTLDAIAPSLSLITLNYDLLAERALHRATAEGGSEPRFFYGGFPFNMRVNKLVKLNNPTESVEVPLGDEIGIYKLHGSLNWAREPHSSLMKMHDDVRAAYRRIGTPQIVPPITEKEMSPEFGAIWAEAERAMAKSDTWIVFGYSMPDYDRAASDLMTRSAGTGPPKKIVVIDPDDAVVSRWAALPNCEENTSFRSVNDWIRSYVPYNDPRESGMIG
jgi:hypothetical protein